MGNKRAKSYPKNLFVLFPHYSKQLLSQNTEFFLIRHCEECRQLMKRLGMLTSSQRKRRESGVEFDDFTNFTKLSNTQLIERCRNLRKQLNQMNKLSDYWQNKAAVYAETKEQHEFLFDYVKLCFFLLRTINLSKNTFVLPQNSLKG